MSGVTSVGSGQMRQRYSQGYMSNGDDLEDDASSRTPSSSLPTVHRARTWTEVLENILWLTSAAFIVYYGDRRSNLISLLWSDGRINKMALHLGFVGVVLNVGLILYKALSSMYQRKSYEKPEILPSIAPFVIVLGFLSFCLFSFALWPIWSFLTIPLLVDSSACLCRVDAGLKTVAGAKKFVPGSKLCIQPSIKPSIHPSKPKAARADHRSRGQSPLLPGLPDDLVIACLIRVPRAEHRKLRLVCKRWYRLLSGNYFYSLRKNIGISEEWIYVIKRDKDGRISWDAFDPVYQLWHPLPPIPGDYSEALGFGCAVLSGCHLYLFGGKDPIKGSMRRVIFYSARTNKWHRAPDMLRRRHFFGSCVIDNCLYVAGGEGEGVQRSLRLAEVYDPNKNRWSFIAEMTTAMVPFIGVVYDGKWFLKGLGSHRQVLSEVYFPETNSWFPVFDGMVTGWMNPSVYFDGKLYALDCKDGCKLRVYDGATDSWSKHTDSKMHLGSSRALEAAALVTLHGKLCIVRNNMSMSLVDVAGKGSMDQQWENIAGNGQIKTFVTNLWSSIAGRNGLRSHIVHCQVLKV